MTSLPALRDAYLDSRTTEKLSAHSVRRITTEIDAIAALLGDNPTTADLTTAALGHAFTTYARPRSKSTVAGCISTWTVFCRWLQDEGHLTGDPMRKVERPRLPRPTPKSLAGGQTTVTRLIDSVTRGDRQARKPWPERDLAVIVTLTASGVRSSEAAGLNVVDVDQTPVGAQLRVTGKGGKQRWVPVDGVLLPILADYERSRVDRFPPKTRTGRPAEHEPLLLSDRSERMTGRQLYWIVRQCYRFAGIGGMVPAGAMVHALRHSYAALLANQGAAATDLQALLGHGALSSTQLYVQVTAERLRAVSAWSPAATALRQPDPPAASES